MVVPADVLVDPMVVMVVVSTVVPTVVVSPGEVVTCSEVVVS